MTKVCVSPYFKNNPGTGYAFIYEWLLENIETENWDRILDTNSILFEKDEDAVAFKLKFGV